MVIQIRETTAVTVQAKNNCSDATTIACTQVKKYMYVDFYPKALHQYQQNMLKKNNSPSWLTKE